SDNEIEAVLFCVLYRWLILLCVYFTDGLSYFSASCPSAVSLDIRDPCDLWISPTPTETLTVSYIGRVTSQHAVMHYYSCIKYRGSHINNCNIIPFKNRNPSPIGQDDSKSDQWE